MHFRSKHIPQSNISITFHDYKCLHKETINNQLFEEICTTKIEVVNTFKYLCVHLDEHFKWKVHIESIQKKLRKTAYAMYRLSNCAPFHIRRQVYFSIAESYMRHGIITWGMQLIAEYYKLLKITY